MRTGAERLVAALIAAGAVGTAGAAAQDAGRVPHAIAGHTLYLRRAARADQHPAQRQELRLAAVLPSGDAQPGVPGGRL